MQPMLDIPNAIHFVYPRGGLSLRWLFVLGTFVSAGGCQSIFCHPFPLHGEVLTTDCEGSCSDLGRNTCCEGYDGGEGSFYNKSHPPHFPFLSGAGSKLKSLGAKAKGHVQDNCLTRTAHAHRDSKNAPPWPRFHPLPTGPIFFACENQLSTDGIPMASTSAPTKVDTSSEQSNQSVDPSDLTTPNERFVAPPMTANYGQFLSPKPR